MSAQMANESNLKKKIDIKKNTIYRPVASSLVS